jgi:hypothetical protein
LSYIITISAVARLIPKPPARVVNKNKNFLLPGELYSSIEVTRSSCGVLPSILQYSVFVLKKLIDQFYLIFNYRILSKNNNLPLKEFNSNYRKEELTDIQHPAHLTKQ